MRKLWPFTFNFLLYAAIAFVAPFIVLYYQELGFTGTQIGLLTGIVPLITLVSAPLWTGLADATHRHRLLMSLGLLGGVITTIVFPFLNAFVPVFVTAALLYIFFAPVTPLADSATMFMLADEKEMYSRIRLGSTLGFGIAAFISGLLVQNYGLRFAFWGCATLFLLGLIVSQKLVYGQLEAESPARGRARTLLTNPRWVLFLVVAFAGGLGIAAYNNYLFPYMKELGANESTMGLALTVGMVSEIPILFFGNRLIKYLKSYGLLMLSMAVTGLRMLLFAASGTPSLVLFFQLFDLSLQFGHGSRGWLLVEGFGHVHGQDAGLSCALACGAHRLGQQVEGQLPHLQTVLALLQFCLALPRHPRPIGVDGDFSDGGIKFGHWLSPSLAKPGKPFPLSEVGW